MKKIFSIIGILIVVCIGIFSQTEITEEIPSNAKIYVFPQNNIWSPNIYWDELINKKGAKYHFFDSVKVETTFEQIGDKGKYSGFKLAKGLKKEGIDVYHGYQGSLLSSIIYKKSRWNRDGSWNW